MMARRAVEHCCPVCGTPFRVYPSAPRVTCSWDCRRAYARTAGRTVPATCPECQQPFEYAASWPRRYCSRRCAGRHTFRNLPNRPARTRYQAVCALCGGAFWATPSTRRRFCSWACWTLARRLR